MSVAKSWRGAGRFGVRELDTTLICRCEEVCLADLKAAFEEGFSTPELAKRRTRMMMGPCQGRLCRTNFQRVVEALLGAVDTAESGGADGAASLPSRIGHDIPGSRPPVRPLTVGQLAQLEEFAPPSPPEIKP